MEVIWQIMITGQAIITEIEITMVDIKKEIKDNLLTCMMYDVNQSNNRVKMVLIFILEHKK